MTYKMHLTSENFKLIEKGKRIVECRLYDDKRKELHTGDDIEFIDAKTEGKKIMAKIVALHRFPSFKKLVNHFPISSFGGKNRKELLIELSGIYPEEDEKRFGVMGIEIACYNDANGNQ